MVNEWRPSIWGRYLTGSADWVLRIQDTQFQLTVAGQTHSINIEEETAYRLTRGYFWSDITLYPGRPAERKVDGLPNGEMETVIGVLNTALARKRLREDVVFLQQVQGAMAVWLRDKSAREDAAGKARRWFSSEAQLELERTRPSIDLAAIQQRLKKREVQMQFGHVVQSVTATLALWVADHRAAWSAFNERHTIAELAACKDLFDRVESKPLTEEQARVVICFDNRVQAVAAAGSGKTSTMVAKAAYAIYRGLVAPDRIVMLAFNKRAAEELSERATRSFERLGMQGVSVESATFHSLGLSIIGKATGEKPHVPEWAIESVLGREKLAEIVDQLKDRDPSFRTNWDLFRFVFGRDLPKFGAGGSADAWDAEGKGRAWTIDGKRVRSKEEATIADWLFYNGVKYLYEPTYKYKTADSQHRQYKPDFYYPDIDLYHEHFALDEQGNAPPHFGDYVSGVKWKRQLHKERGTSLVETTSHQIRIGATFAHLERELTSRGVVLDPNPDRQIPVGGKAPMQPFELISLARTFISHVKSNSLSMAALRKQLDAMPRDAFKYRHQMFLDIIEPVIQAWDAALRAEGGIDFEDMLNLAATHLENGSCIAPYELVMADEFQDASRARARLCRALVNQPGRFLFAVGDDWQSINRFAGADVSVMTGFRDWFAHGQILKLEQTFRCPQALCDVSSHFVSKNPAQLRKNVVSKTPALGPVLRATQVDDKDALPGAVYEFLRDLGQAVQDGTVSPGRDGKVSVFILGRYRAEEQYMPAGSAAFLKWLDVSFLTIHRSKGGEADYVILPEMLSTTRGRSFPSTREDDPVLALAMPTGDSYHLAEERRLFYVALTRARRNVAMFTVRGMRSTFLEELCADGAVVVTNRRGEAIAERHCPACKQGLIVLKASRYGDFLGCTNFPACGYKPKDNGKALPAAAASSRKRPSPGVSSKVSSPQSSKYW